MKSRRPPARSLLLLVITSLLLSAVPAFAATRTITFKVTSSALPDHARIYLAGNHPALGSWKADGVALEPDGEGRWTARLSFEEGEAIEYKLTLGSWHTEALAHDGSIPPNSRLTVTEDQEIAVEIRKWKSEKPPAGQITGKLEVHRGMRSEGIRPRDVLVWLPTRYGLDTEQRYPVLYMHDGQQVFDPATATHGIDWQVDEQVTRLTVEKKMRDIIVVAITSTQDRAEEYGDNDEKGAAYRNFVVNTLKPFIDEHYRTLPDREHTAVMGASMGGLVSFLLVYHHPAVFSRAGCLSSAFWIDFPELLAADWPPAPVKIYLDNGGVGLEQRLQPGNDWMLEVLQKKGFQLGKNLVWFRDEAAEHNEHAWSRRVHMPLLYFFGTADQTWIAELPPPGAPFYDRRDQAPPRTVTIDPFQVVGLAGEFPRSRDATEKIDLLWERFLERKEEVRNTVPPDAPHAIGLLQSAQDRKTSDYLAGLKVDGTGDVPEGMTTAEVAGGSYLVFTHRGPGITGRRDLFDYIQNWYLPRHALKVAGPMFELYDARFSRNSDDSQFDVYVPVPER